MSVNISIELTLPLTTVAAIQNGDGVSKKELLTPGLAAQITNAVRALPFQVTVNHDGSSKEPDTAAPAQKKRKHVIDNPGPPIMTQECKAEIELDKAEARRRMRARARERSRKAGTPSMQLFVKTLDEHLKTETFEVHPTTPIREVMTTIEDYMGVPYNWQRLLYAGMQLETGPEGDDGDEQHLLTLADYHIQKDSTLHLLVRQEATVKPDSEHAAL